MREYKVTFINGSTDIVAARNAGDARDKAARQFGRVRAVEVLAEEYEDEPDARSKDEDEEEDEEEEGEEDDE